MPESKPVITGETFYALDVLRDIIQRFPDVKSAPRIEAELTRLADLALQLHEDLQVALQEIVGLEGYVGYLTGYDE